MHCRKPDTLSDNPFITILIVSGVDVSANQEEISNHETFQLEADSVSGKWYIRTMQDKYFNIQAGGGLQAGDKTRSDKGLFDLIWQEDGSVCFKASNGKAKASLLFTEHSTHSVSFRQIYRQ